MNGSCLASGSVRFVTGLTQPTDLVADDTNLYWTDIGDNTVHSIPKAGGSPSLLASGQAKPIRMAVDDAYVYWSSELGGAIVRVAKGGGTPVVVIAANSPQGLVVDSTNVYWCNAGDGTLYSAPKAGGTKTALAAPCGGTNSVTDVATDGTNLYTASVDLAQTTKTGASKIVGYPNLLGGSNGLIASNGGDFYYVGRNPGSHIFGYISSTATQTSISLTTPVLGVAVSVPLTMAFDGCSLFFNDGTTNIWQIDVTESQDGYGVPRAVTTAVQKPVRILPDGADLFWTDSGWIGRVPK